MKRKGESMSYRFVVSALVFAIAAGGCGDAEGLEGAPGAGGGVGGSDGQGGFAAGIGGSAGTGSAGGSGGFAGAGGGVEPTELRTGRIAVLDMEVSNPGISATGAEVSIIYRDAQAPDVTPIGDPDEIGSCAVFVYDVDEDSDPFANREDEGMLTIAGMEPSPIDLACSFDGAIGRYRCPVTSNTAATDSLVTTSSNGTMSITFLNEGGLFTGLDVAGAFLEIDGFQNSAFNGRFPIVEKFSDYIITLANVQASGESPEVVKPETEATFTVFAGEGPTGARKDFLGLAADTITLTKEAGPNVPAIDRKELPVAGANLNLVNATPQPHQFPDTAQDLTFSCDPTDVANGGNCGPAAGAFYGLVLEGRTTDAPLTDLRITDMPAPVSQFATFRCRGLSKMPTITMARHFVEAVLGTNPTRIETRLLRVNVDTTEPATSILVGHGMVGYTNLQ